VVPDDSAISIKGAGCDRQIQLTPWNRSRNLGYRRNSDVDVMIAGTLKYQKAGEIAGSVMVCADVNLRVVGMADGKTLAA
jgi:hypothetical protein